MAHEKRKQSLYFPEDMLAEIQAESTRQDRSLSWLVQQAWRIARDDISRFPSINEGSQPVPASTPATQAEAFATGKFEKVN